MYYHKIEAEAPPSGEIRKLSTLAQNIGEIAEK